MMKPDWKDAPEWANWLTMDNSLWWYWWEFKPSPKSAIWSCHEGKCRRVEFSDTGWLETLEQRP